MKIFHYAVMWRSLKILVNGTDLGLQCAGKTCKLCSWTGFVNFYKYKTVNCNLQGALGQTGHVRINLIDGVVPITMWNFLIMINCLKC